MNDDFMRCLVLDVAKMDIEKMVKPRFCSRTIQSDLLADLYFGHFRIIHRTIAFF